ncbi:MAG: GTPase HflX [Oscillospiraceae bacterium]|nr:GTPase HflX [Oscillospiraceae bacterium]
MELYENSIKPETAVLVTLDTGDFDAEASLAELEELARTAGAEVYAKVTQKREKPDPATFVGSGRLREIKELCENADIDLLIFDSELTPSQLRNIEKETDVRVVDRTTLILDIFAASARSSEGKLQVELAQLKYSLPRLTGKGTELSRLGGGIGTRGPGESKLESDRRHIRRRIHSLETELAQLEKRRERHRERRKKDGVTAVAIVGYTNAGKSTLLNTLTDAGVFVEDKLFATLDPTSRALKLPDGRNIMLIDTVGFISRLPHKLVEAFKSTLEEAVSADLILNVCDASNEEYEEHLSVTNDILKELGVENKPVLNVLNKCDKAENVFTLPENDKNVRLSALNGTGLDRFFECMAKLLPNPRKSVKLLLPFNLGSAAAEIRKAGVVSFEEYRPEGIYIEAVLDETGFKKFRNFELKVENS